MTPSTLITLGVLAGIFIVAVLVIGGMYNALVKLRNKFENAWAQIDVQLERRFDLIPDLVET
ncbi:MAG: LemA family protein, partial [Verrucomicrobiales bacterium]|nr:LemA family protein [Verrucomicrobiales bacterium]